MLEQWAMYSDRHWAFTASRCASVGACANAGAATIGIIDVKTSPRAAARANMLIILANPYCPGRKPQARPKRSSGSVDQSIQRRHHFRFRLFVK
jgi:hypothetical protein